LFFQIQMFFYTIMKLFITLLVYVNKSRTSAGSLSLTKLTQGRRNQGKEASTCPKLTHLAVQP
jgi:hypothetical protein